MANLNEEPLWESGIYQIEETDVVKGGENGVSNIQPKQLANRTLWLKENLPAKNKVALKTISGNSTMDVNDLVNTHTVLQINSSAKTITLNLANMPNGSVFSFSANSKPDNFCVGFKINQQNITFQGTPYSNYSTELFIYTGESITFLYNDNVLYVIDLPGRYSEIGDIFHSYVTPFLALKCEGQLLNRADYPRLWNFISKRNAPITSTDAIWLQNGNQYRGLFSPGNGSTTFRLPDLRGLFIRNSDNSRGLDVDRAGSGVKDGTFQDGAVGKHTHDYTDDYFIEQNPSIKYIGSYRILSGQFLGSGSSDYDNKTMYYTNKKTSNNIGIETRPVNVAITAYIKY